MTHIQQEYTRRINLVLDYIGAHLSEEMELEQLADIAMFSKYHFHRVFKAMLGETLQEYIRRIRLEKAVNMICYSPESTIFDIALTCGYSSQSNFTKAFKKNYGFSPTDMRTHFQESNSGITHSKNGEVAPGASGYLASVNPTDNSTEDSLLNGTHMEVEVRTLPKRNIAYVRSIGPYRPETIGKAFDRLCQWAGPRGLLKDNPQFLGVSYDNPDITPPDKCRYDASVVVPDGTEVNGDIGMMEIQDSLYAVYHCEVKNWEFAQAWDRFYKDWLPTSGYQPDDRPVIEQYFSDDVERENGTFVLDLCLPVKPL